METFRLKKVFDIESFNQVIPIVKQVFMNWDTDFFFQMNIFFFKTEAMNILSEPLVNDVI